ncbi:hypothetical protein [Nocardia sp. NPDC050793]|uniref:hypothetical protein n=1 Tax=Nocardia sp. NPDC050793 TaxID=3155159 RepID=UPI0033E97C8A
MSYDSIIASLREEIARIHTELAVTECADDDDAVNRLYSELSTATSELSYFEHMSHMDYMDELDRQDHHDDLDYIEHSNYIDSLDDVE